MRFVSLRGAVITCMMAMALLALGMTGFASAKKSHPEPDVLPQCTGAEEVRTEGSTFQGPAGFLWTGFNTETEKATGTGFNVSSAKAACKGEKPKVRYEQKSSDSRGSGSCLKTMGIGIHKFEEEVGGIKYPRLNKYPFCGTDEAPSESVKTEVEAYAEGSLEPGEEGGQKGEGVETLPVAQGAEAIIIHLPKDCLASSEITTSKGKKESLGRLALDDETIEEIYRGTITTWKQALEKQGTHGHDKLTCTEGGENDTIRPVVRHDKSGTTHIFKAWLLQVYSGEWAAEAFEKVNGTEEPCKGHTGLEAGHTVTWAQTAEGCENQRWPEAAHVLRPTESGNQGVVNAVNSTESSIGYADLAVAHEFKFFSEKEQGGENKKGEQNKKFWAVVQDSKIGAEGEPTYEDPSTKGDTAKGAESNCKDSVYVSKVGEEFPPKTTRKDWSKVKAEAVSKTYGICGLTYDLAPRQYYPFLKKYGISEEESKKIATTVHDYLVFVTSKTGGAKELKTSFYEGLPKAVQAEAELGAEEIGNAKG